MIPACARLWFNIQMMILVFSLKNFAKSLQYLYYLFSVFSLRKLLRKSKRLVLVYNNGQSQKLVTMKFKNTSDWALSSQCDSDMKIEIRLIRAWQMDKRFSDMSHCLTGFPENNDLLRIRLCRARSHSNVFLQTLERKLSIGHQNNRDAKSSWAPSTTNEPQAQVRSSLEHESFYWDRTLGQRSWYIE